MTVENRQLMQLIEQGFSVEDVAAMHGLDPSALRCALESAVSLRKRTVEELQARYAPEMVEVLAEIALSSSANDSARVAAAKTIIEGKGIVPEQGASKLSEMFKRMKVVVEQNRPASASSPRDREIELTVVNS